MPFTRPSPYEIRDRLAAEIGAGLPGADARLRRSLEEVLVRMTAMASHELHGHLAWIALQILPDTAEDEIVARHAAIWGMERIAAAAARGNAAVTGTPDAVLPAGSEANAGPRALVRSVAGPLPLDGAGRPTGTTHLRALRWPAGAKPERLQARGWIEAADGSLLAVAAPRCP